MLGWRTIGKIQALEKQEFKENNVRSAFGHLSFFFFFGQDNGDLKKKQKEKKQKKKEFMRIQNVEN